VRLPYHLSAVTQATAHAALEFAEPLLAYVAELKAERDRLVTELRALGCEVTDSDANFVQFGRFEDAHGVWQRLLNHGVLVRDNGVPGRLRASTGTRRENDAFLDAVRAVLKELKESSE
jgi:histidinol-phosphate aminotransferase